MPKYQYLNIGCGNRFHPDWFNIDQTSKSPEVQVANLEKGIPLPDQSMEVVYHSHVLEHIPKQFVDSFLSENYRVLKPGGICRIVVPDLEQVTREYLNQLDQAILQVPDAAEKYQWITIEFMDQFVRKSSGGEFVSYLKNPKLQKDAYVFQRIGQEARDIHFAHVNDISKLNKMKRFFRWDWKNKTQFLQNKIIHFLLPQFIRKKWALGTFLQSGELHQWMYDRYSLPVLMAHHGFKEITQHTAFSSSIPDFISFGLDSEGSQAYKPNSIYFEGRKVS